VALSTEWHWHFYYYKFWIGDHFLTSCHPTCLHCYFTFLLINDVRMTTFSHQLLSRKASMPELSLTMWVRIFQPQCYGVRHCVAHGLCGSRFHSTRRKARHHVTWCLAKTSYQTSRWDMAVTNGHCSRTVLPPTTPPETETCSVRTFSSLSQTFRPPNSPDLNTVNLPSRVVFSRQSTIISFSSVDKMKRPIIKIMAETTAWCSHCQFIILSHFIHG